MNCPTHVDRIGANRSGQCHRTAFEQERLVYVPRQGGMVGVENNELGGYHVPQSAGKSTHPTRSWNLDDGNNARPRNIQ